uniref:Uncharacterized protein n=1 Tax=Anguilla anguilla TaxID=7936 RepID=A0A0E9WI81_ANGAN
MKSVVNERLVKGGKSYYGIYLRHGEVKSGIRCLPATVSAVMLICRSSGNRELW